MAEGTTEKIAKFIVDTSFNDLPKEAIERTKIMFLDTIGVALAETAVGDAGKIVIKYVKENGGVPEATVIGGGLRTSAPNAALANATSAHALDYDDWEPTGHPSCMMVATSLALGEKLSLPGKDLIVSYVLGVEVYDKVAGGCPDARSRGWHGTGIYGTIGSAAAAAKLLGLSVQQTVMALGIAACSASGIMREHGTMCKPYTTGKAARNGVEAALLARDGFTSRTGIIEFPLGMLEAFLGKGACDYAKMTSNLGNPFHIISPGLGLKYNPTRMPEVRGIEAILELRKEHGFTYDDVDWVEIKMSKRRYTIDNFDPKTGLEGKFSGTYVAARLLLDGKLTPDVFTDEKVTEPIAIEAMDKIKPVLDETIPDIWKDSWTPVTIKLKDGRTFSKRVDIVTGDPRKPLPISFILQKYRDNACRVLSYEHVERSINLLQNLEKAENIREPMDILITSAAAAKPSKG